MEAARSPATDEHRSASERFLFEQLESMSETAGLFAPNRELEFLHGTKSAEADLVSTELKLAIEIDVLTITSTPSSIVAIVGRSGLSTAWVLVLGSWPRTWWLIWKGF